jgi:hypothetical protein
VASLGGCDRLLLTPSSSAYCSSSPPLAASVCVGDSSSSAPDCTSTSPAMPLSAHEIAQLRCLLDAWDSLPTGFAGSTTEFSGIERPPPPSPGTSPWLRDTGASFHMTPDSSLLHSV